MKFRQKEHFQILPNAPLICNHKIYQFVSTELYIDALSCITCQYGTLNGEPLPSPAAAEGVTMPPMQENCLTSSDHPSKDCEPEAEMTMRCVKVDFKVTSAGK